MSFQFDYNKNLWLLFFTARDPWDNKLLVQLYGKLGQRSGIQDLFTLGGIRWAALNNPLKGELPLKSVTVGPLISTPVTELKQETLSWVQEQRW